MGEVDTTFLVRQSKRLAAESERLAAEMGGLRDDLDLLLTVMMRLDGAMAALLGKMQAASPDPARIDDRPRG